MTLDPINSNIASSSSFPSEISKQESKPKAEKSAEKPSVISGKGRRISDSSKEKITGETSAGRELTHLIKELKGDFFSPNLERGKATRKAVRGRASSLPLQASTPEPKNKLENRETAKIAMDIYSRCIDEGEQGLPALTEDLPHLEELPEMEDHWTVTTESIEDEPAPVADDVKYATIRNTKEPDTDTKATASVTLQTRATRHDVSTQPDVLSSILNNPSQPVKLENNLFVSSKQSNTQTIKQILNSCSKLPKTTSPEKWGQVLNLLKQDWVTSQIRGNKELQILNDYATAPRFDLKTLSAEHKEVLDVLQHLFDTLQNTKGVEKEGAFRKSNTVAALASGKTVLEHAGKLPDLTTFDEGSNATQGDSLLLPANLIKSLLRDLSTKPFMGANFNKKLEDFKANPEEKLTIVQSFIETLPQEQKALLKLLHTELNKVAEHQATNRMGTGNLATVIIPNLIDPNLSLNILQRDSGTINEFFQVFLDSENTL